MSLIPTNLYGPHDNFDIETSHVLPAMLRKFHEAMIEGDWDVELWGSGTPLREFLYVDDLVEADFFALERRTPEKICNVGSGDEHTFRYLALKIQKFLGGKGEIIWDSTKPDGTPRKLSDSSKLRNLGWAPRVVLERGLQKTYHWLIDHEESLRLNKL